jgi:hypothetical protein
MSVSQTQADGLPRPVPRVRLGLRVALAIAVALGLVAGARALWNDHEHSEREHARARLFARYASAEAALARLMPADLIEVHSKSCEGGACGFSKRDPPLVAAMMRALLPGSKLVYTGEERGCPASGVIMCLAQVEGRFHGFEVVDDAFWHLLVLPYSQRPPRGAIEVRPRYHVRHHPHRTKRLFVLGSEVYLGLREPATLRAEAE